MKRTTKVYKYGALAASTPVVGTQANKYSALAASTPRTKCVISFCFSFEPA